MTDLPALETFVAVARHGSLVRAASALGRTQPSLSARLSGLERSWGTRLFRRQARGMTLTPEGARLLPLAEAALDAVAVLDRTAGLPVARRDELRVGAGDALGRALLPSALARLLQRRPELSVRLVEGPAAQLIETLRAGEIDLALVGARAAEGAGSGVSVEPLLTTPVVAVEAKGGSATPRTLKLESLRHRRLVTLQRGSSFRRHLEEAFETARIPFRPAVEVGNLSLVHRFAAAGLGLGLAPRIAFEGPAAPAGVTLSSISGVPGVGYVAVRRSGVPPSPPSEALLAELDPQKRRRGLPKRGSSR